MGKYTTTKSVKAKNTPYARPSMEVSSTDFTEEDKLLSNLFYGNQNEYGLGHDTRQRRERGVTQGCYPTQLLLLIRFAMMHTFGEQFDPVKHANYEKKIMDLITGAINRSDNLFVGQEEGKKVQQYLLDNNVSLECIAKIKHVTLLSTAQFRFSHPEKNCEKLKYITLDDVEALFRESFSYPIPLAFGSNNARGISPHIQRDKTGGIFDIAHWLTLYQGKLHGAAGMDDFNIKFGIYIIEPETFHAFLQSMCPPEEEEKERKTNQDVTTFKEFLVDYIVPFKNAVIPKQWSRSTHTLRPPSTVKRGIQKNKENFIDYFNGENIYNYNMFKLLGRDEESYINTLESILVCISPPLEFINSQMPPVYACARSPAYDDVARVSSGGLKKQTQKYIKKRTKHRTTNRTKTRKRRTNKRRIHKYQSHKRFTS